MYNSPQFNPNAVPNSFPAFTPQFITINNTSNINFYGPTSNNAHTNNKYVSFSAIVHDSQTNININNNNNNNNNNNMNNEQNNKINNYYAMSPKYDQFRSKTPKSPSNMSQKKKSLIIKPSQTTPTDTFTADSFSQFINGNEFKKKNENNYVKPDPFDMIYNNKYNNYFNSNQQTFSQQNNQISKKKINNKLNAKKSPKNRPSLLSKIVRSTSQFDIINTLSNSNSNKNQKIRKTKSLKNLNISHYSEKKISNINNGYSSSSSIDSEEMNDFYNDNNPYLNKKLIKNNKKLIVNIQDNNNNNFNISSPILLNNKSAPIKITPKYDNIYNNSPYNNIYDNINTTNYNRVRAQTVDTNNYNIKNNPLTIKFDEMFIKQNNKEKQLTPIYGINTNVPPPPTDSPSFEYLQGFESD